MADPDSMSCLATFSASLTGMAKPMPMLPEPPLSPELERPIVAIELVMPMTRPFSSNRGPPEFPGLMAASIWTALV